MLHLEAMDYRFGHLLISCWSGRPLRPSNNIGPCKYSWLPQELDDKTLLLKITHALALRHKEAKL